MNEKKVASRISIIVINKDDRGISDTLTALLKITSPLPFEIIVVDASDYRLDDIKKLFPSISWHDFIRSDVRKRSIPKQRNFGIKHSTGDIVVFIDSNCIPSQNWLNDLTSPIINEGEMIVAGGVRSKTTNTVHDNESEGRTGKKYLTECPTINLAFTRDVFKTLGAFDENFDYGSDVDFSWRANFAGFKIRYAPTAQITHDWGTQADELKRAYRYGRGRARLYIKHPNNWDNLFKNEITVIIYPLYILGLPLTILFWPYPLLILVPLFKNINDWPLKKVSYQLVYAVGVLRGLINT